MNPIMTPVVPLTTTAKHSSDDKTGDDTPVEKSINVSLKEAVGNADAVAIKSLIQKGANPNLKDSKGWTTET